MSEDRYSRNRRVHLPCTLLAILLLAALGVGAVSALTWQKETVDPGNVGRYTSLALDPFTGYPRVSYYDSGNGDLKYAWYDGSAWHPGTVDWGGDVGQYTSLAIGPATGHPRISYYDVTNGDLKYASWTGSSWSVGTVDSAQDVGQYTSLALDPATGRPRISYYDVTNGDLKFAAYDGSAWQIETVASTDNVGRGTSLELDNYGYARIAYNDYTNGDLKYATQMGGGTWQLTPVDAPVEPYRDVGQYPSLALNGIGRPRISYFDFDEWDLKYAAWNGYSWTIETLDRTGEVGIWTSLALDPSDRPRVSYQDLTNLTVKFAWYDGSAWQTSVVDSLGGGTDAYTSLALKDGDTPVIGYHTWTGLKVATLVMPTVTSVTPGEGAQSATVPVTIAGSGFSYGATVELVHSDRRIPAADVVVASPTEITCSFAVPNDAPAGAWDVVVTNPGGWMGTGAGAFTVYVPVRVISISPNQGSQGETVPVTIRGTMFDTGATVKLVRGRDEMIQAADVVVVSPTEIACEFALPADAAPGAWDVRVANPGGLAATLTGGFTILPSTSAVTIPGGAGLPTDPDGDGKYEDVNGNGRADFADVVLYFNQMTWISANEPVSLFDYNGNGRIDFADVVWLFNNL